MQIDRVWAMPNSATFTIAPVWEIIEPLSENCGYSIDPFFGGFRSVNTTNDLNPEIRADYHMDALDFLRMFYDEEVDLVLFDPPYSPRQVSECYKKLGHTVNMQTTQASYSSNMKKEISRIVKPGGKVVTCSWNSGGIGKKYGFEIERIRLVAHGGWHNDTIVVVEIKQ